MDNLVIDIAIVIVVVIAAGWIVVLLDRRSRNRRSITGTRILPYTRQSLDDNNAAQHEMSTNLQSSVEPPEPVKKRVITFVIIYVSVIAWAVLMIPVSFWALDHKGDPLADFVEVGVNASTILIPVAIWIVRLVILRIRR